MPFPSRKSRKITVVSSRFKPPLNIFFSTPPVSRRFSCEIVQKKRPPSISSPKSNINSPNFHSALSTPHRISKTYTPSTDPPSRFSSTAARRRLFREDVGNDDDEFLETPIDYEPFPLLKEEEIDKSRVIDIDQIDNDQIDQSIGNESKSDQNRNGNGEESLFSQPEPDRYVDDHKDSTNIESENFDHYGDQLLGQPDYLALNLPESKRSSDYIDYDDWENRYRNDQRPNIDDHRYRENLVVEEPIPEDDQRPINDDQPEILLIKERRQNRAIDHVQEIKSEPDQLEIEADPIADDQSSSPYRFLEDGIMLPPRNQPGYAVNIALHRAALKRLRAEMETKEPSQDNDAIVSLFQD